MALIQVTASELEKRAAQLSEFNSNFRSEVNSLEANEQSLASMWEGQAKSAFHNAFNRDKGQMDIFAKTIDEYVSALNAIATKYREAESRNADTATKRMR